MGDEHHGIPLLIQLLEEAQHLPARPGIQRAGGLIRQNDRGIPRQCSRDGYPLLLTAGKLDGQIFLLVSQAHTAQRRHCPLLPLFRADTGVQQGQLHVFQHGQFGDQVVLLEDKPQHFVPDLRLLIVVHGGYVHAPQMVGTAGGNIQTADDVHGGGFAGTGLAHNGYKLPLVDGEAHAVQSVNVLVAHMVDLVDVF